MRMQFLHFAELKSCCLSSHRGGARVQEQEKPFKSTAKYNKHLNNKAFFFDFFEIKTSCTWQPLICVNKKASHGQNFTKITYITITFHGCFHDLFRHLLLHMRDEDIWRGVVGNIVAAFALYFSRAKFEVAKPTNPLLLYFQLAISFSSL